MYHALFNDSDTSNIDQEDLPYAVSRQNFIDQLDQLADRQVGLYNRQAEEIPDIVITFDDGHHSNLDIAAPLLVERGLPAYFFITTNFTGQRTGFMSAEQLRSLAELPGMLLGSHGTTHRFFDDLAPNESIDELRSSRNTLEALTGKPCHSISFPGGRYHQRTLKQVKESGYRQWFGSDIGLIDSARAFSDTLDEKSVDDMHDQLLWQTVQSPIERIAVRQNTSLDEFTRMIRPDAAYYKQLKRRGQVKNLARRVLGNRLYHGLYKSLSVR